MECVVWGCGCIESGVWGVGFHLGNRYTPKYRYM